MSRNYELYLRDILKAIERIEHHLNGLDEAAFKADELRKDGVLFNLMTIGEAVKTSLMRSKMPRLKFPGVTSDGFVIGLSTITLQRMWILSGKSSRFTCSPCACMSKNYCLI